MILVNILSYQGTESLQVKIYVHNNLIIWTTKKWTKYFIKTLDRYEAKCVKTKFIYWQITNGAAPHVVNVHCELFNAIN